MPIVRKHEAGTLLAVKVVPGASRDRVSGPLGERLKVQVRAAPEKGRANKAVCGLLAEALGVGRRQVAVLSGAARPEKAVVVRGMGPAEVARRLGLK